MKVNLNQSPEVMQEYNQRTKVFITIDMETGGEIARKILDPERMIWGRIGNSYYGIPRIMDLCDHYNLKATFFVSVFESIYFGKRALKEVCEYIKSRGHDIQLHTHPWWISQGYDYMADYNTLRALVSNGILIDSSMFYKWASCRLNNPPLTKNSLIRWNDVIEIPVSAYESIRISNKKSFYRHLNVHSNTTEELIHVIHQLRKLNTIVILLHGFDFLLWNSSQTKYHPDYPAIKRFSRLLEFISMQESLRVITMRQFSEEYENYAGEIDSDTIDYVPYTGWWLTYQHTLKMLGNPFGGWKTAKHSRQCLIFLLFAAPLGIISHFLNPVNPIELRNGKRE